MVTEAKKFIPEELLFLQDALPTGGFIKQLRGWKELMDRDPEQPLNERHSLKPNWSGEAVWGGQKLGIEVWEISETEIDIVTTTDQRRETWTVKETHNETLPHPYISVNLISAEMHAYLLAPMFASPDVEWKIVEGAQKSSDFYDISQKGTSPERNTLWNEKNLTTKTYNDDAMSKADLEKDNIFQILRTLRTLMLEAKPTTHKFSFARRRLARLN